jgi:hypothetical protein
MGEGYNDLATINQQLGDDRPGPKIYDFSLGDVDAWKARARELRRLDDRSRELAAAAEQQLAQADSTSVLRGIGLAVLSLRAEYEAEQARRPE